MSNAPILLISLSPFAADIEDGVPFARGAGKLLKQLTEPWDSFTLVDVPTKTLKLRDMEFARRRLQARLSASPARILVPMDGPSLYLLTGEKALYDWRGYLVRPDASKVLTLPLPVPTKHKSSKLCPACRGEGGEHIKWVRGPVPVVHSPKCEWIIPCIAPHDVIKGGFALLPTFGADIDRIERAVRGELAIQPTDVTHPHLSGSPNRIAVDVETWTPREIGLADDMSTTSEGWTWDEEQRAKRTLLAANQIIAHNAAFDIPELGLLDEPNLPPLFDTMLAAYMVDPDGKKSLNWIISRYMDAERHKHLKDGKYNVLDVRRTFDLSWILTNELVNTGQLAFFRDGMMPALPTLMRMTRRGLALNRPAIEQMRAHARTERAAVADAWPQIPFSRPLELGRYFGIRKSDEDTLRIWQTQHPDRAAEIDAVLKWREHAKILSTYGRSTADAVYPSYLPGTRDTDEGSKGIAYSGRPTAHNPNIQNQPPIARRCFVPRAGHKFVSLDWSQIEPRISAALSGDETLAADLELGFYDAVAEELGVKRKVAKMVALLSGYLGSPRTLRTKLLVRGTDLSQEECKGLQDRMFRRYHRWARWRQLRIDRAARDRQLTNVFGKWAPFHVPHPARAANFDPQSCAACILWYTLPRVEAAIACHGATIATTVHDELLLEVPDAYVDQVSELARVEMERPWEELGGLRVPTKSKVGDNWLDMLEFDSPWRVLG